RSRGSAGSPAWRAPRLSPTPSIAYATSESVVSAYRTLLTQESLAAGLLVIHAQSLNPDRRPPQLAEHGVRGFPVDCHGLQGRLEDEPVPRAEWMLGDRFHH